MQAAAGLWLQIGLFGQSVVLGAAMFVLYDMVRMFRRIFSHGIIWVSIEDFIYWTVVGTYFFLRLCQVNNGIIRAYILLGMALGALLYYRLVSRHFVRWFTGLVRRIKKELKKYWKFVTIRIKKLWKPEEEKAGEDNGQTKKTA